MISEDRALDLLAAAATEGIAEDEERELNQLLKQHESLNRDDFDLAAAEAHLAFATAEPAIERMPDRLKQRILADARSHIPVEPARESDRFAGMKPRKESLFSARLLGWYVAAAMLALALWAPWTTRRQEPVTMSPSLAEQRQELIEGAADLIRVDWATPEIEQYAEVRGEVIWSRERQSGFMRLVGLPTNRPDQQQYQLWIVDPDRDSHPIDGGVFDIGPGEAEVIVPIDAKLEVGRVAAFAITLEKPGGVVVSAGPLLVIAPVT